MIIDIIAIIGIMICMQMFFYLIDSIETRKKCCKKEIQLRLEHTLQMLMDINGYHILSKQIIDSQPNSEAEEDKKPTILLVDLIQAYEEKYNVKLIEVTDNHDN